MRISEPAADLAVAAALLSAREDVALPRMTVCFRRTFALRRAPSGVSGGKQVERSGETWFFLRHRARRVQDRRRQRASRMQAMTDLPGFRGRDLRGRIRRGQRGRQTGRQAMDGFTIVDGIVAGVIVISAILAYSRGFVREVMSIVGWIARRDRGLHLRAQRPAADPRDALSGRFHRRKLRTGRHRHLRGRLRRGARRHLDLHAAVFLGRAALGRSAGWMQASASSSAWRAACCWWSWPSSPMTAWWAYRTRADGRRQPLGRSLRPRCRTGSRRKSPPTRRAGSWPATSS